MPRTVLMETDVTVTIFKSEYEQLCEAQDFLRALYEAGVDNWEGIEIAQEALRNN